MHGPLHALCVARLARLDRKAEPHGYHLRTQLPVTLSEHDEPEPDGALVRGSAEQFASNHPGPSALAAVFEVAASSLAYDRESKQRRYAVAGLPLYAIVNLEAGQVELYSDPLPSEGRYAQARTLGRGASFAIPLDGGAAALEVPVGDLLPPAA